MCVNMRDVATRIAAVALLLLCGGLAASAGQAVDRVLLSDSGGGPFYARIESGLVHMTDQWVAIAFYRDTTCVRADFNLLNFFDFASIPAIFACPLTVQGFELWDGGAAPRQSKLFGNGAVPVWFVSVADYNAALPGLTLTELLAMPSLQRGAATFFEETLHPMGGARQVMLQLNAHGWLEDGRGFRYSATEARGVLRKVQIELD